MRALAIVSVAAAAALAAGAALAQEPAAKAPAAKAPAAKPTGNQCFQIGQFKGWTSPNDHTIYLRINVRDVFKLGVKQGCPNVSNSGAVLINRVQGSASMCTPADWDIAVQNGPGAIPVPCIVTSFHKMTPEEAAAIPKKYRPY
jgi:hypothetical protein